MRSDLPAETITARPKQSELLEWLEPHTDPIDLALVFIICFYCSFYNDLSKSYIFERVILVEGPI